MSQHILAVVGDYYHDRELARRSLNKILAPFIQEKKIHLYYADVTELAERLKQRPDAVILFAEDRLDPQHQPEKRWMTPEIEQQIESYTSAGGLWLAWHSGLASYAEDGAYVTMLRGCFEHHPEVHQEVTYYPVPGTPLGELGRHFCFLDEHYFVKCREEETEVFLRSESVNGKSIAGWYHDYGNGSVICITPAHLAEGLLNEEFVHLMRQLFATGLQWA
ncbi:ThuA domain-containing protein [Paenibacillus sp. JCM 10914]|uniref:ThuA domain-containing protein n=1 Tax=Paenibacillus sp. JCM 10914 TaxID=1236974 RepID=UPI0003CC4C3D|nr:ThuA domain-containing protein [Paenibacillus sp. JCM 10914]GAE07137.1 hypothetical protein JCM10914_3348 [Paenibacillus sp. JCM 10914]